MDTMSCPDFKQSNIVLKAQTVQLKHEGKGRVQHKPTILEEDLQKLYQASELMPVKLMTMSSVQCQTPLALLCTAMISNSCTQKSLLFLQILWQCQTLT